MASVKKIWLVTHPSSLDSTPVIQRRMFVKDFSANYNLFYICGENLAQFKLPVKLRATPVYKYARLRSANKVGLFALKCVTNQNVLVIKSLFFILASTNMLALALFRTELLRSPSKRFWEGATHRSGKFGVKIAAAAVLYNAAVPPLFSCLS